MFDTHVQNHILCKTLYCEALIKINKFLITPTYISFLKKII